MSETSEQVKKNMDYAAKIIKSQIQNARDYINKELEFGFIQERQGKSHLPIPNEEALKTMEQHPFVHWLHKQDYFLQATAKIAKARLRVIKRTDVEIILSYMEKLALVRLCALQIHLFAEHKRMLTQIVVSEKERKPVMKAMEKINFALNHGGLYFSNGAMQLVFHTLLQQLLKNPGHNIFSSKRSHENVLRQAFIKIFLQELIRTYEGIKTGLAVNIALEVTDIFFMDNMDKRDAEREVEKIFDTICAENKFLEMTAKEILFGSTSYL
ncbi:hypothetical protein [Legionella drancourtii]|uniref:Uncharacterized protein n=1 Tax=Legionella drancourtii LLAP12 TaxID=658187 RepID=G9EL86_9GAMM|nr:hypothetical protein [Legionella drancourtii]EHL31975.1 hypothetical protein LDG_6145 [Legionella drancourtii LLAP12]